MPILELNSERGIRQHLADGAFDFNRVFGQTSSHC